MSRKFAFLLGFLMTGALSALASVPEESFEVPGMGAAPSSMDQELTEIRAKRQADLRVDNDLNRLSDLRGRYRENLPLAGRRTQPSTRIVKKQTIRTSQAGAVRAKPSAQVAPKKNARVAQKTSKKKSSGKVALKSKKKTNQASAGSSRKHNQL